MNITPIAKSRAIFVLSLFLSLTFCSFVRAQNVSFADIQKLPKPPADHRLAYGSDPLQFGELRLPKTKGKHPVVIVVHGGCWFAEYDLHHLAAFSDALTRLGVATWTIEYRRIGNVGGAWPGTFQDVANGADYLREVAKKHPLDLKRVVVIGHSAGGQLALWLAARKNLPKTSVLYSANPLPLTGVVSLAGISDLRNYRPNCDDSVNKLLGGSPEQFPERYQQTSPIELLPLKVPVMLLHGGEDRIVPIKQSQDFAAAADKKGDKAILSVPVSAGHFDLISPQAKDWDMVETLVRAVLNLKK
ncbi:MAG: alpha/beta fold hydrolase [Blastocatellia bacterium]|nr:alpha/beta fold hydrolase [Blastocatellia bacterium]